MKSLIKNILSKNNKTKLKKSYEYIDGKIIGFFVYNGFLSSIYYLIFSRKFYREHQSVLKGRVKYKNDLSDIGSSSVLLRRNTHRIEKGLIMQPRRSYFAKDYIYETVQCYKQCNDKGLNSDELNWAHDVLHNYFEVVDKTQENIQESWVIFEKIESRNFSNNVPYTRQSQIKSNLSYSEFKALCIQRRSVRWFKDIGVEKEKINDCVEVATLSPSACNRQPFKFHTILDKDRATTIAKSAMGTSGFADNIPAVIVVVGDLSAYPYEKDRHVIYIDGSLSAMQLMLTFETVGLSSCPINWPDIDFYEEKLSKQLGLKHHERPIMMIAVGYADEEGMIPFSQKKSAKDLIKYI